MKLIKWFKNLLASKVSINIEYVIDGVDRHALPKVVYETKDHPLVKKRTMSNLRFVEEHKKDAFGHETTIWFTEEYVDGRWDYIPISLGMSKERAIELHLKLLNEAEINVPTNTKTVLWEGLGKDETVTWAELHR